MEELLQKLLDKIFDLEVNAPLRGACAYKYESFVCYEFKELIELAKEIDIKKSRINCFPIVNSDVFKEYIKILEQKKVTTLDEITDILNKIKSISIKQKE